MDNLLRFWQNLTPLGVLIAGISAFLAFRALQANHDWSRRKAAMDAVAQLTEDIRRTESLVGHFQDWFLGRPIELADLQNEFDKEPGLEMAFKQLLDTYENLANGVLERVYDEAVIRRARRTDLITMFRRFEPYIQERRKVHGTAYDCLESVAKRWEAQRAEPQFRRSTG